MWVTRHHSCRVSPFGHPRINARLTAPRGITQPPTSFIGSQCQGIHHALLNTYNTKNQFEKRNCTSTTHPHKGLLLDARNHYPQIKHHTPPPKIGATTVPIPGFPHSGRRDSGPVASKPNSVSDDPSPAFDHSKPVPAQRLLLHPNHTHYRRGPSHESPRSPNPTGMWAGQ